MDKPPEVFVFNNRRSTERKVYLTARAAHFPKTEAELDGTAPSPQVHTKLNPEGIVRLPSGFLVFATLADGIMGPIEKGSTLDPEKVIFLY
jgi:hypothetical protein